jgi:outer membrane protein
MQSSRILVLSACVLLLAHGVVNAAGPTAVLLGDAQATASAPGTPLMPGENWPLGTSSTVNPSTRSVAAQSQPTNSTGGPIPPGSQLTLKDAIAIALKYHPRLQEAADNTSAAQQQIGQARSYLGPQLFGAAQYLRSTDNGIGNASYYNPDGAFPRLTGTNHNLPSNDVSQTSDTSNNYMGGVMLSQFLVDFGRRHGFVSERQFEAAAAAADQQLTELDLIFEVSQRYFALLQAKRLIGVYEKALEQRQYHLHEAQIKANAGLRPQLDTYVTEAEVERSQLHLVDARNDHADAKVALDNALGLSDSAPAYEPADILTYYPVKDSLQVLLDTAFRSRPDLTALQDQAKAMGARIVQYKSDYYPTVNAVGGYSALGTGTPAANNFNAGIVITWPIFNSFLTTDQIAETRLRQHAILRAIEDLRQEVIAQVHTALLNWQASLQRISRAEKTLAASRAELELAEKRYEAGLTSIIELEDAQRSYTGDDAAYADALYGFSITKAAVDRATGRSLSEFQRP